jgi:hypothetical protein
VLAIIARGWTLTDDERPAGRLPKYNPERRRTFAISDWAHVCRTTSTRLAAEGAPESAAWAEIAATKTKPTKSDQDQIDACICLVSALHLAKGREALFVGCCSTGYIVVPDSEMLRSELEHRCMELWRESATWVRVYRLPAVGARDTCPLLALCHFGHQLGDPRPLAGYTETFRHAGSGTGWRRSVGDSTTDRSWP